jgi:micrococcal nuclease
MNKRLPFFVLILFALFAFPVQTQTQKQEVYRVNTAGVQTYAKADFSKMHFARVIRHIDGDTVHIEFEEIPPEPLKKIEKIRMIGVDTPETVHPKRDVEFLGKEASEQTKKALFGKRVAIALDWDTRDRYGRLLAYIYTAPGRCHNAELIAQGYGHAYTRFPFQFLEEFRALEKEARKSKRGLWQR